MTDFHDVQFPDSISKGSSGGPLRRTDIVTLRSGYEERNAVWGDSRRSYDAGLGLRYISDLAEVLAFWESRLGSLYGFRWKDWVDYTSKVDPVPSPESTDALQAENPETSALYTLVKRYTSGNYFTVRKITKPVPGSVVFRYNGVDYTDDDILLDYNSGKFYFTIPKVEGQDLFAGYFFDVPVRFASESITVSVEQFNAGAIPQIDILEVKATDTTSAAVFAPYLPILFIFKVLSPKNWLTTPNRLAYIIENIWPDLAD